jgi:type IV pilus assembly protein PilA
LGEERALTLAEVLVVIVVVGSLAVIAMPSFGGQESKGTDSEAKSMAVMAAKAMESCAAEKGGYDKCSRTPS